MSHLVFLDTETTGLDPDRHEVWEVAAIVRDNEGSDHEHVWQLPVDLGRADPVALKISGFHDRYDLEHFWDKDDVLPEFADEFAELTRGAHLVGAVVSFDEERLRRLLRKHGECPMWHYHLIDVEAEAVGYLRAQHRHLEDETARLHIEEALSLPWKSDTLSRLVGVEPPGEDDRHTALGDARWVRDLYDAITGGAS